MSLGMVGGRDVGGARQDGRLRGSAEHGQARVNEDIHTFDVDSMSGTP